MNAERLNAVCQELKDAVSSANLPDKLAAISYVLQNIVNQPAASEFQTALSAALDDFYTALERFPTDRFSPAWRQVLDEIGASPVLGTELSTRVRSVMERNQITPATALEEMNALHGELSRLMEAVNQLTTSLSTLGILGDSLSPGECELGVMVPRAAVHNRLADLGTELRELDFIFGTFAELTTGERVPFEIRAVSSSELMVFLATIPSVCASIAFAAEKLINTYKSLLEIKKLRAELADQGVSEDELTGITDHANTMMESAIDEITTEVVLQFGAGTDTGRENELTNALRISLRKLANRIDQGYNIEVRVQPLDDADEDPETADQGTRAAIHRIQSASETLQFMKHGGRILSLPERDERLP